MLSWDNAGGFMFWFQEIARGYTDKPVLLSSLVALPSITVSFAKHEQVLLLGCIFAIVS
jgi:hypothetical protein